MSRVAQRIRQARTERRWTLRDVAERVGCTFVHIHDVETGRRGGSPALLLRLARVLDISGSEIRDAYAYDAMIEALNKWDRETSR